MLLGQTAAFSTIVREKISDRSQKHDVRIGYDCSGSWSIQKRDKPTVTPDDLLPNLLVNSTTCEPLPSVDLAVLAKHKAEY